MLILLFMAVTSSTSAELIAVSSLLTFDVYKTYFRPETSSAKLVQVSHWGIVIYALTLATFCCILNAVGLSLTWLLVVLGIIVGGASVPVGLILLWKRMSTIAAIVSPWVGLACGLTAWLVTASKRSGGITIASTGNTQNAVAGNITSWGVGIVTAVILSYAFPQKYASTDPKHIERSNKISGIPVDHAPLSSPNSRDETTTSLAMGEDVAAIERSDEKTGSNTGAQPKSAPQAEAFILTGNELVDFLESKQMEPMDPVMAKKAERLAWGFNIIFFVFAIILVPFTLFGSRWIFNKPFFTGWITVSFIWVWCSMCICVIYPIVESAGALRDVSRGLLADVKALVGKKKGKSTPPDGSA